MAGASVEPVEKILHFPFEPLGRGRLEMKPLAAHLSGDNLHGAQAIITPSSHSHSVCAAVRGREQGCMPAEQPFSRERLGIVTGCVQHHFDDAFDVAVGWLERTNIDAETAGN